MLRSSTLLDLFPCAARGGVSEESLFAASQLVTLPVWNRQLRVLLRDAVPEVFDELKALGSCELEERCEFGVHGSEVTAFSVLFKRGHSVA